MQRKLSLLFISVFAFACQDGRTTSSFKAIVKKHPLSAVMFIAPDCPLCMSMAKPYLDLSDSFPQVQFLVVHSGKNYDAMELNMFANKTGLKKNIFRDRDYEVARQLDASITPEFFLIDSSMNILYQGLFDDRIEVLGKLKQTWDNNYLKDAIESSLVSEMVKINKTTAVGCTLEF